ECYFQLKKWKKAEKNFKEVISLHGDKEKEALYRLSQVYLEEGRYREAENILSKLEKSNIPGELREGVLSLLGELMLREGKGKEAQKYVKQLKREFPSSAVLPYAWFNLAVFYWDKGKKALSREFFLFALSSSPSPSLKEELLYSLGKVSLELTRYQESRRYFSALLQEFPASKQVNNAILGMGISYYRAGNWKEANKWFSSLEKKSIKETKIKEALWLWKGKVNLQLGDLKKSTYYLSLLSRKSPYYAEARYFLSRVKKKEGKIDEARSILKEVSALKSKYAPLSLLLLSQMDSEEGNFTSALSYLAHIDSFQKSPYYPELLYQKGLLLEKVGRYQDALKLFTLFLKLFPSHKYYLPALFHRGVGFYYLENYAAAEKDFEQVKKAQPASDWAEGADYYLVQVALKENKLSLFFKRVEKFLQAYPKSSWKEELIHQAGIVAKRNDKLSTAVGYFRLYLDKFPRGRYAPEVTYLLAYTYFLKGEQENSARVFLSILKKFPSYPVDRSTLLWLAEYFLKNKAYKNSLFVYGEMEKRFKSREDLELIAVGKGEVEVLSGKLAEGIKRLEGFLEKYPRSRLRGKVYFLLGEAYSMKGEGGKSVDYWKRATEGGEYAPQALCSLGGYFFSLGSYAQAYRYYLKLAYLYQDSPFVPQALYRAGISLKRLGKEEEADKVFQELFTRFPTSKEAGKLRKKHGGK
ncbi:MAG: tetratricopeptide repeat protein, partial [Caldiserica bacterium]|nr:tetratricopeptide repeat protein [Caldisericota bacterium]